jgi:hypothetical protein
VLAHPYCLFVGGPVLKLITNARSTDTVEALEHLLEEARAGRVIGIAYVAMHKTYDYTIDIAGETKRCPTLTRGMLHLLDDELATLLRNK